MAGVRSQEGSRDVLVVGLWPCLLMIVLWPHLLTIVITRVLAISRHDHTCSRHVSSSSHVFWTCHCLLTIKVAIRRYTDQSQEKKNNGNYGQRRKVQFFNVKYLHAKR